MATQLPAKFKNSSFVQSLASSKDRIAKQKNELVKQRRNPLMQAATTCGGAFVGGAVSAAVPSVMGVPTPGALGLVLLAIGIFSGSAAAVEAGTGNLALIAGAAGEAAYDAATGTTA